MQTDKTDQRDQLINYEGKDKIISSIEAEGKFKVKKENAKYLKTGLTTLDRHINGFCPGQLIVVSGPTGCGKTTLARTFTYNLEKKNVNCLWFSYEDEPSRFFEKFPSLPLFYLPEVLLDNSMKWIKQRILEAIIKYRIEIVFIDHLHYLIDMQSRVNMSLHIGSLVRYLKIVAVKYKIVVVLIAHLQKIEVTEEPEIHDIRDSSFIGQEADKVIMIWRGKEDNEGYLKICKDRDTGIRNKHVNLILGNNIFRERENERQTNEGNEEDQVRLTTGMESFDLF